LVAMSHGMEFSVDLTIGSDTVKATVDTASSDTWVVTEGFDCRDANNKPQAYENCKFGPAVHIELDEIKDEHFYISYESNEWLYGKLGYSDVTVAGVTVKRQEIALVEKGYWDGDGKSSGLIGLAYKSLTSAYDGADASNNDNMNDTIEYNPLFTNMKDQGLVDPLFSLAIQRGESAGSFSIGGIPSQVNVKSGFVQTPIRVVDVASLNRTASQRSFYTIYPDGFKYNRHSYNAKDQDLPFLVDSGTSVTYLPTKIAEDVLGMYDPPAHFRKDMGTWVVACNATPPSFAVTIGDEDFFFDPADMILQEIADRQENLCNTGVDDGQMGPYVLGVTFLQNVVAVFDVDKAQMKFAEHEY
ncbi:acid protease, partial [Rhizodiscina lignyota]